MPDHRMKINDRDVEAVLRSLREMLQSKTRLLDKMYDQMVEKEADVRRRDTLDRIARMVEVYGGRCLEAEYTDVGEAWGVLNEIRRMAENPVAEGPF